MGREVDIIGYVITEAIQHKYTRKATGEIVQPSLVEHVVFLPSSTTHSAGAGAMGPDNLSEAHGGAVADLPVGVEQIYHQDFR